MITRIPALEFLQFICGSYEDKNNETRLRIWGCGYGVAIDLSTKGKSTFCGIAGTCSQEIECFAQIGLPNLARLVGKKFLRIASSS